MVPELARMSVVIKSQHETSVMTGNYEMAYTCGLLCRLAGAALPEWTQARELQEKTLELLKSYAPADDREKNVLHMLHFYHPDDNADGQVRELVGMGFEEVHLWEMNPKK